MSARKRLVKRHRWKVMGGTIDLRIYDDGSMRARCDHPSNDPEVEMAMAGRLYRVARETFAALGLPVPVMQPIVWRDDP